MASLMRLFCFSMIFIGYGCGILLISSIGSAASDSIISVDSAEDAAARLGEGLGGIPLEYEVFDLKGEILDLEGFPTTASIPDNATEIEALLHELNAKKNGEEIRITLTEDKLFDSDQWDIKPEAETILHKIAMVVKKLKKKNIRIEGYTYSKGSDSSNRLLSKTRAEAVKTWLLVKGDLGQISFTTIGYGESKPGAQNGNADGADNPEGRAKNGRVELIIR